MTYDEVCSAWRLVIRADGRFDLKTIAYLGHWDDWHLSIDDQVYGLQTFVVHYHPFSVRFPNELHYAPLRVPYRLASEATLTSREMWAILDAVGHKPLPLSNVTARLGQRGLWRVDLTVDGAPRIVRTADDVEALRAGN